jgi:hypothetical protein
MTLDYASLPTNCKWRYQWLAVIALVMGLSTGLVICGALQLVTLIPSKVINVLLPNNNFGLAMCSAALYAIHFGSAAATVVVAFIAMRDSRRGFTTGNAFWIALAGMLAALFETGVIFIMASANFP